MSDVVVVGSGPNGLAAAVTMARCGLRVTVLEEQSTVGGGARTLGLGLAEGIEHDLCSAVHPMAWASPFFRAFDLEAHGVDLLTPDVSYAQPLPGGGAAIAYRDLARTVDGLAGDGAAWRSLVGTLSESWEPIVSIAMGDRRSVPTGLLPRGIGPAMRFASALVEQGTGAWNLRFRGQAAPALLTGVAAHAVTPLPSLAGAGTALLLAALGHAGRGWAIPRGGSQAITGALVADLRAHGGDVVTDHPVDERRDLPPAAAYLFDTTPGQVVRIMRGLPRLRARGYRAFRHGNGAAKVDFVLDGPVPWAAEHVGLAGTVHVGGTRAQMAEAEAAVAAGRHAERPMCLVSDPSVVDDSRRRGRRRPLWAYAHVPAGSTRDVTEDVIAQIERFAPGFRDVVAASRCVPAAQLSHHNRNYVGGDFAGGAIDMRQMIARPTASWNPYATGLDGVYLCSQSTPPGPGVHGMAGRHAAERALRDVFGIRVTPR